MFWVNMILGLALMIAPFVFGFNTLAVALWTCIVFGVIVAAVASYDLYKTQPVAS